jgi:acyl carrier protein
MNRQQVLDGIQQVASSHLEWTGELKEDQILVEVLSLDSIRLLTLVVEVENHFSICIEDGDEAGLEKVGDLVDLLLERGA